MCNSVFILFVGLLLNDVTSFNPLLTYSIRFKNITVYPNVSAEYTINQRKEKQYVNGNITLNWNKEVNNVVVIFNRCNPEGINCEYFQTWKISDLCNKLKEKNQLWSSWYGAFDPPMVCPINKIHYKIINGTFEVGPAMILYPDFTEYQWKVVQKFYSGNVYMGGYMTEASIFGYRKKTKSILNMNTH